MTAALVASAAAVTVVVCSRNGARGIVACLDALAAQELPPAAVVVVDDGSTDATAELALRHPLRPVVLRHEVNRGLGAARTTGIAACTTDLVAFTDDDCRPGPGWLVGLVGFLTAGAGAVAVGGSVHAASVDTAARRYADATRPLAPVEVAPPSSLARLAGYVRSARRAPVDGAPRAVASLVGASMLVRRSALEAVDGFDPAIRFGGDEEDLCRRLRTAFGPDAVRFAPDVVLAHEFDPRRRDVLRRARAYGRGNARTFRASGSRVPPLRPFPLVLAACLLAGLRWRAAWVVAAVAPVLLYPPSRFGGRLPFCYLAAAEDAATLVGFLQGVRS
ncbi:glycosyltransferase [Actinomycetospora termitidis]|uniref:Glycosyltransferase n=1 Tax=Actinomycetospora termitidis TaxID=3053470 RepID=A0ABT7MFV4_9PSEU|nr:glycosyltransferase [Actinomycetospora sp. Odt1-22]MDL5159543.1 glycosyltransferase [Actinomycetospora sp. Odt1-22]